MEKTGGKDPIAVSQNVGMESAKKGACSGAQKIKKEKRTGGAKRWVGRWFPPLAPVGQKGVGSKETLKA